MVLGVAGVTMVLVRLGEEMIGFTTVMKSVCWKYWFYNRGGYSIA